MGFNSTLQVYKYLIIEAVMKGDDEDFMDLIYKLILSEQIEKEMPSCKKPSKQAQA